METIYNGKVQQKILSCSYRISLLQNPQKTQAPFCHLPRWGYHPKINQNKTKLQAHAQAFNGKTTTKQINLHYQLPQHHGIMRRPLLTRLHPLNREHDVPPPDQPHARPLQLIRPKLLQFHIPHFVLTFVCITLNSCLFYVPAGKGLQIHLMSPYKNPKSSRHQRHLEHLDQVLER